MISFGFRGTLFARAALASLAFAGLASCSGSVDGPPPVVDPTRITILPETAVLYSGLPTEFTISGGTGAYLVSSSNQAVVQVSGSVTNGKLTVVPAPVVVDTEVTLTVRDTGTTPLASATLTVRPGTVSNEISIVPSGTQGGSCSPALCSGGDAAVSATISQGGIPLPARGVRLDVVSGDFRFITSPPGLPETLDTAITVITDETGEVHARIRALPGASNQTAILQVTDLGTNAFQRAVFLIAQATGDSPGFFVTPEQVTFTGPRADACASNISAEFFIFGGSPPYTIFNTGSSAFTVSRDVVATSGGSFTVSARGVCVGEPGLPILVRDAAGRTVTAQVANEPGTAAVPEFVAAPSEVTLSDCNSTANVALAGGTGRYFVTGANDVVTATIGIGSANNGTLTITRRRPSPATTFDSVTVGVSDGISVKEITVNLDPAAAQGACS